ncbi:hypothetical protein OKE80_07360 [Riemerella anatipestifer]|nr:hypothetical protein [Riemerella anatipestifer]MCW0510803.1 hypothetical protein [Riemerella anatipestifer]MCW0519403.1 hypothetical protein [Riemerella anatipestifer]MDY3421877.1 hypothetical protein [Riemerella anatipestifer]MDY3446332.1 hypothetical protein [Riemerella anatipestifer]
MKQAVATLLITTINLMEEKQQVAKFLTIMNSLPLIRDYHSEHW